MSFGRRSVQAGGSGIRGAADERAARRLPTYAELSKPGPDELADEPLPTIANKKAYFVAQLKWDLIIKGSVAAVLLIGYLMVSSIFSGVEDGMRSAGREVGHSMRELAKMCGDPAARARLEREGWTVRVGPDGGCRLTRGQ